MYTSTSLNCFQPHYLYTCMVACRRLAPTASKVKERISSKPWKKMVETQDSTKKRKIRMQNPLGPKLKEKNKIKQAVQHPTSCLINL